LPPVAPPPQSRPPSSSSPLSRTVAAPAPSRRISPLWALLAAVALIAAGAIGWLARGSFGAPVAAPAASVALPALPALPRQSTKLATLPLAETPKVAEPQAAMPLPPVPERQSSFKRNQAGGVDKSERSPDRARVASRRGERAGKASRAEGRALQVRGRDRVYDRRIEKRAVAPQRALVPIAPSHRDAQSKRDRSTAARASGLNCRRARNDVTAAICSDASLAALDRQLTSRFATLDRGADPATVQRIHHGETTFLNARQSCRDRECIAESYRQRLRELDEARN
jgi:hypothetical protein